MTGRDLNGSSSGRTIAYVSANYSNKIALAIAFAIVQTAVAQLQPARTIILIGPPGSGKTIQAEYLRKRYKIPAVSMSQLLQQEVHRNSAMGVALAPALSSGELLGDGPANDLMMARLLRPDAGRGFILDGYPATEGQARALDQWLADHNLPKPIIVVLQVPEEVSRNRMIRRRRADDQPDNIERRLRDYREIGRLVEQRYGTGRIVRVDGTGAPPQVALLIAKGIDDLPSTQGLKRRTPEDGGLKHREPEQPAPEEKQ
jgi:adenylate kinase